MSAWFLDSVLSTCCTKFYNGFLLKISICTIMPGFCKLGHNCDRQSCTQITYHDIKMH